MFYFCLLVVSFCSLGISSCSLVLTCGLLVIPFSFLSLVSTSVLVLFLLSLYEFLWSTFFSPLHYFLRVIMSVIFQLPMKFHLDIDDIGPLCTWTWCQPTLLYSCVHSFFLEYHSMFNPMLHTRASTSIDRFCTILVKVKNDVVYVPSFSVFLFRCVQSLFCFLTNIRNEISFILFRFDDSHIHLDDAFLFSLFRWSNSRLNFFVGVSFFDHVELNSLHT